MSETRPLGVIARGTGPEATEARMRLRELGRARAAKLDDETEAARAEMLLAAAYAQPRLAEVYLANATDPVPGIWMSGTVAVTREPVSDVEIRRQSNG